MRSETLKQKIRRLEAELAACEAEEARLARQLREMNMHRVLPEAKTRKRLKLKTASEKVNGLRLKLWGLRNLNLPG